eukprot:100098_1
MNLTVVNRLSIIILALIFATNVFCDDLNNRCTTPTDPSTAINNAAIAASYLWAVAGILSVVTGPISVTAGVVFGVISGYGGVISNGFFWATNNMDNPDTLKACLMGQVAELIDYKMKQDTLSDLWDTFEQKMDYNMKTVKRLCNGDDFFSSACADDGLQKILDYFHQYRSDFTPTGVSNEQLLLMGTYGNLNLHYFQWYFASKQHNTTTNKVQDQITKMQSGLKFYLTSAYNYLPVYLTKATNNVYKNSTDIPLTKKEDIIRLGWLTIPFCEWKEQFKTLTDLLNQITPDHTVRPQDEFTWDFDQSCEENIYGAIRDSDLSKSLSLDIIVHYDELGWKTFNWDDEDIKWRGWKNGQGVMTGFVHKYEETISWLGGTCSGGDCLGTTGLILYFSDGPRLDYQYSTSASVESDEYFCPSGSYVTGYQLFMQKIFEGCDEDSEFNGCKVSDYQAMEGIRFVCRDVNWKYVDIISDIGDYEEDVNNVAEWYIWNECPAGYYICGLNAQVDDSIFGDETSWNNVKFKCCPHPNGWPALIKPIFHCENGLLACSQDSTCSEQESCLQAYFEDDNDAAIKCKSGTGCSSCWTEFEDVGCSFSNNCVECNGYRIKDNASDCYLDIADGSVVNDVLNRDHDLLNDDEVDAFFNCEYKGSVWQISDKGVFGTKLWLKSYDGYYLEDASKGVGFNIDANQRNAKADHHPPTYGWYSYFVDAYEVDPHVNNIVLNIHDYSNGNVLETCILQSDDGVNQYQVVNGANNIVNGHEALFSCSANREELLELSRIEMVLLPTSGCPARSKRRVDNENGFCCYQEETSICDGSCAKKYCDNLNLIWIGQHNQYVCCSSQQAYNSMAIKIPFSFINIDMNHGARWFIFGYQFSPIMVYIIFLMGSVFVLLCTIGCCVNNIWKIKSEQIAYMPTKCVDENK